MGDWLATVCGFLPPGLGTVAAVLCVVLAVLILAIIGLGFGPLRVWLGVADRVSSRDQVNRLIPERAGIVDLWRLWRDGERVRPAGRRAAVTGGQEPGSLAASLDRVRMAE